MCRPIRSRCCITDAAINIDPDLDDKRDIVQNAIDLAHALGIGLPKVAILSAVETVYPKIRSTVEAAALCKMVDRGQITGGIVDGPLAFDNAVSRAAARQGRSSRRSPATPTSSSCPTSSPATCWPSSSIYLAGADAAGHRARRARADRADEPLGRRAVAARLVRARRAARSPLAQAGDVSAAVLVLNVGSSSIKFALYVGDDAGSCSVAATSRRSARPALAAHVAGRALRFAETSIPPAIRGRRMQRRWTCSMHRRADCRTSSSSRPVTASCMAAMAFGEPVRIDDARARDARSAGAARAAASAAQSRRHPRRRAAACAGLPQIACFDTAFHRTQPAHARMFALPRSLDRRRHHALRISRALIRISRRRAAASYAGARAEGRVVIAHLGHGASLCAMRERRSVATTMGFTALDGLMMGTRCGAIDPGVVLYLLQQKGMTRGRGVRSPLQPSGLLGVSGISDDMRVLEADGGAQAEEAMDLFAYRAAREIGSLAAALGGLDVLVFSAGIGERSASMRARICAYSAWLGVALDADANAANGAAHRRRRSRGRRLRHSDRRGARRSRARCERCCLTHRRPARPDDLDQFAVAGARRSDSAHVPGDRVMATTSKRHRSPSRSIAAPAAAGQAQCASHDAREARRRTRTQSEADANRRSESAAASRRRALRDARQALVRRLLARDPHWTETLSDGTHVIDPPDPQGGRGARACVHQAPFARIAAPALPRPDERAERRARHRRSPTSIIAATWRSSRWYIATARSARSASRATARTQDGTSANAPSPSPTSGASAGSATLLMRHLIDVARSRGVRSMMSIDEADNLQRCAIWRKFLGFRRARDPEDATQVIHTLTLQ